MRLLSPRMTALKPVNGYLDSLKTTIFSVMSALATEHNAVNLGQVELLAHDHRPGVCVGVCPCCSHPCLLACRASQTMRGRCAPDIHYIAFVLEPSCPCAVRHCVTMQWSVSKSGDANPYNFASSPAAAPELTLCQQMGMRWEDVWLARGDFLPCGSGCDEEKGSRGAVRIQQPIPAVRGCARAAAGSGATCRAPNWYVGAVPKALLQ